VLAIRGLQWQLQNAVACRHVFEFPSNRFPPKECLLDGGAICFVISPPQPLLDAKFCDLPSAMYHGEVCESVLEIRNKGAVDACNVRVQLSHPGRVILLKAPVDLPQTFMPDASSSIVDSAPLSALSSLDIDGVYTHSLADPIPPGACVRVHFLVHSAADSQSAPADESCSFDLKCSIVYSSPTPPPPLRGKSIRFRLLRLSSHIKIERILDATITCRRSSSSPDAHVAAVQLLAHAPCILSQISCLSGFWAAAPLGAQQAALRSAATPQGLKLQPQHSCNLVFRFKPQPSSPPQLHTPAGKRVMQTVLNLRNVAAHGVSDMLSGPLALLYSRRNAESGSTSVVAAHRLAALMNQVNSILYCEILKCLMASVRTMSW
jgi:hypothetical protein